MSIRLKVILPYFILTVVVAVIGVYVVTQLVANSLSERLSNQLLEAGRAVSDGFVLQENNHVETALSIAFYEGVAEAVASEDASRAYELVLPAFVGLGGADNLILLSPAGKELVHIYIDEKGEVQQVTQDTGVNKSPLVTSFLVDQQVDAEPRRALGLNLANDMVYYYTALPISRSDEFLGVIVVGTTIQNVLPSLKTVTLADIIIYSGNGHAIATTLVSDDSASLNDLSISADEYEKILGAEELVFGNNFKLNGRDYRLLRGPLEIGADRVGVFAVVLPLEFVLQSGRESRSTYIQLFAIVMAIVIAVGFFVARLITSPLYSLVNTSQAIAGGDLEQRTGINSRDEIGELAATFDDMTGKLQERTQELEQINEHLRKIDRTKTNFIQISAHELRTPLTLIMGYSQMLEQDTKDNPELLKLAQGILEGSERMASIVDSMLDVSRIDNKSLVLRKVSMGMDVVIKKVCKGFNEALVERNISLDMNNVHDLPPVFADPELIQKVFYHIIMNAIKFTPNGGSIKISGRYLNGVVPPQVEVTVADTGIGIDPSSTHLIFEKFGQTGEVLLHSSGKTKFKGGGPGLGLAIARGILDAHGGHIRAESPGYSEQTFPGSKFIVMLPVEKKTET